MTCVICTHRITERGQVCQPCRSRLAADLADLLEAWAALSAEPGRGASERISGSREAPLGVKVTVLDLIARAEARTITDPHGDQTGHIPVAATLDAWARDWAQQLGHMLPAPTVPILARWLGLRLDWACDEHPGIDDYATEIRTTLAACRAAMGDIRGEDTVAIGPCPTSLPDGSECGYRLRADPYADNITCRRCQSMYHRRRWLWIHDRHNPRELDVPTSSVLN